MTPAQREIAATILEAGRFSYTKETTPDEEEAAAFLFDNGILYLSVEGRNEVIKMLREPTKDKS